MGNEYGVYPEKELKDLDRKKRNRLRAACVRVIKSNAKINAALRKELAPFFKSDGRSSKKQPTRE
jgi:hypothetical protein